MFRSAYFRARYFTTSLLPGGGFGSIDAGGGDYIVTFRRRRGR
jgi:hypothetical protein